MHANFSEKLQFELKSRTEELAELKELWESSNMAKQGGYSDLEAIRRKHKLSIETHAIELREIHEKFYA